MAFGSSNKDEVHTDLLLQARQACYKARDEFYACVEKQWSKKPTEIAHAGLLYHADCKKSRAEFVENYRASCVKHFDRLYKKERKVRHLDDMDSRKAKLYTFDKDGNHWKERGVGTVKLLKHNEVEKVRLTMRQSKTMC